MRNFGQKHELQYVEKSAMLSRNFKIFMQQNSLVHYFQNINYNYNYNYNYITI